MLGGVVACALVAHELLLPFAGSSLTIHFADRMSSRSQLLPIRTIARADVRTYRALIATLAERLGLT